MILHHVCLTSLSFAVKDPITEGVGDTGAKITTPNVSLACRLFWIEDNQGPEDSGRNFDLPRNCLKEFRWRTWSQNRAITRDICEEYGLGVVGDTQRTESTLCPNVSGRPSKHLFAKHLLFHLHFSCLPPFGSPKPLPPTFSFVFNRSWYLRWRVCPLWWVT